VINQLYKKGKEHYKRQNYEQALEIFKDLLNYEENHLIALKFLSLCYAHLKDYRNAIKIFEKGIKLDEDNEIFWMNLTKALFQVGNFNKLIKKARKANKKFQDNEFFCNIMGVAYLNLNDIEKAIKSFKEALTINQRSHKAWIYLCRAYDMKGVNFKYDDYKANTEISWYFLSKELMLNEYYEDAIYACNFALKINPSFEGAFTLRNRIKEIKERASKPEIGTKSKRKVPKRLSSKRVSKMETSRYEEYDEKMQILKKRFKELKSAEKHEKEESLDQRMEKAKERFENLKLEESDTYIESKNEIEKQTSYERDIDKKTVSEHHIPSYTNVSQNKVKSEPEIYLGDRRRNLKDLKFVIDGANIARYDLDNDNGDSKGKVWKLKVLIDTMESLGISDYKVMFDRALNYTIDDPDTYENLLKRDNFLEMTGGTQADNFILQYAKKEDAYIISNDMFRDFYKIYGRDWIVEKRIAFQFVDEYLFFDKITVL